MDDLEILFPNRTYTYVIHIHMLRWYAVVPTCLQHSIYNQSQRAF